MCPSTSRRTEHAWYMHASNHRFFLIGAFVSVIISLSNSESDHCNQLSPQTFLSSPRKIWIQKLKKKMMKKIIVQRERTHPPPYLSFISPLIHILYSTSNLCMLVSINCVKMLAAAYACHLCHWISQEIISSDSFRSRIAVRSVQANQLSAH